MLSLLQVNNGEIVTARHFAELERKARTEIQTLETEQLSNWFHTVTSGIGVVGCLCLSPAAPFVAAVGGVAAVGAVLYGHGQFFGSKGIQLSRAKSIAQAMDDATEQQWEGLFASCDDHDLFVNAFEAGLLEIAKGHPKHGDVFRKTAAYIHAVNPDSIEGFTGRLPTALIAPVEGKVRLALPVTDDEITHICTVSAERITQSADRKWAAKVIGDASALRDNGNRQGATNKLIYNSRLTEREFAKEGITKVRLKLIKEWAASGAPPTIAPSELLALPPAQPIDLTVETPIVQTIAAAPTFTSFKQPIAPVEELDYEIVEDYEEDEEEEEPIAVALPTAKPAFHQVAKQRTQIAVSIWDTTDLETIEASELGNMNKIPFIIIVAPQGSGKTVTMAYIFSELSGKKALFTPKIDDHRNPAIQAVYDTRFGYNPETKRGSWFGDQGSFHNGSLMDLDWYLKNTRSGSALDFIGAVCSTAQNRTATGTKRGRHNWFVFYDESNQVFTGGFTKTEIAGIDQGKKGAEECQWFIESNLKSSLFNFRAAGVQMWVSCVSETVQNIGFKGCADVLGDAWHLYPGQKAIEIARKHKQLKLAAFLQRAIDDGYAIAILEKGGQQFKIIRMPKLAELSRFDPIIEDDEVLGEAIEVTPEPIPQAIEINDVWEDAPEPAELEEEDFVTRILKSTNLTQAQKDLYIKGYI